MHNSMMLLLEQLEVTGVQDVKKRRKKYVFYIKFCQFFANIHEYLFVFLGVDFADQAVFSIFNQSHVYQFVFFRSIV